MSKIKDLLERTNLHEKVDRVKELQNAIKGTQKRNPQVLLDNAIQKKAKDLLDTIILKTP